MEELAAVAAFVGMALLEGAISYVGGKAMASALGDPTITDVKAWIQNAVAELEAFVSAELKRQLDENIVEQMRANLQQALFVTTAAVAYRLFILQGLYELDNDPGHIRSARAMMDPFTTRAIVTRDRVAVQMLPATHFKINCTIRGERDYSCMVFRTASRLRLPTTLH